MSTSPLSVRMVKPQKDKINKTIDRVMEERTLPKGDALEYIIDVYDKHTIEGSFNEEEFIPPNVMDALRDVSCEYLQYMEDVFYCLEHFHKSKKKNILSIDPRELIVNCKACKQGKADIIQKQIDKERRKESIKKLIDFASSFAIITERGFMATNYMCVCNALEGKFIISRNNKTINCPLVDSDLIDLEEICLTALNPDTEIPPCQYLITLDHLVKITKEDLETMNLVIPKLDDAPLESTPLEDIEETEKRKVIESDIIVDGKLKIPNICPNCKDEEIELSEDDKGKYCHKCGYRKEAKEK